MQVAASSSWQHSFLHWLGHDMADSPPSARAELVWTNLPASWGVFVLIAIVAAMIYAIFAIYRREMTSCPPWAKTLLAALRSAAQMVASDSPKSISIAMKSWPFSSPSS